MHRGADTALTEVAYLFANGVRLARVVFEPVAAAVPSLDTATADAKYGRGSKLHVFFELGDHLGSSSLALDQQTSELVEATTYQAYGATESDYRPDRWGNFREDYRFTGKEEDVEVGLQYFGKRYLNPLLGRWVSADPLAVHAPGDADLNLYAYVSGSVFQAVDPLGLTDVAVLDAEGGGRADVTNVDRDTGRASARKSWEELAPGHRPETRKVVPKATLTDTDYQSAATELGVDVAAIKAVAEVEAPNGGFGDDNQPTILYERHYFSKLTKRTHDTTNPEISARTRYTSKKVDLKGNAIAATDRYGGTKTNRRRMAAARVLDEDAALKSASWGRFQIMGAHYKKLGYASIQDFVKDMNVSERGQLRAFVKFIKWKKLDIKLKNKDWAGFARGYNGKDYATQKYDTKLKAAYTKHAAASAKKAAAAAKGKGGT